MTDDLSGLDALLAGLQASGIAQLLRTSVFLYPTANVLHVLGALVFFAAVAAMDVRVLRAGSADVARAFIRRVRPIAIGGLLIQVVSGGMLLAPEALHIWHNPVFRLKLIAILLGLLNVVVLELMVALRRSPDLPGAARATAGISLVVWLTTAALGRLIAYF